MHGIFSTKLFIKLPKVLIKKYSLSCDCVKFFPPMRYRLTYPAYLLCEKSPSPRNNFKEPNLVLQFSAALRSTRTWRLLRPQALAFNEINFGVGESRFSGCSVGAFNTTRAGAGVRPTAAS